MAAITTTASLGRVHLVLHVTASNLLGETRSPLYGLPELRTRLSAGRGHTAKHAHPVDMLFCAGFEGRQPMCDSSSYVGCIRRRRLVF